MCVRGDLRGVVGRARFVAQDRAGAVHVEADEQVVGHPIGRLEPPPARDEEAAVGCQVPARLAQHVPGLGSQVDAATALPVERHEVGLGARDPVVPEADRHAGVAQHGRAVVLAVLLGLAHGVQIRAGHQRYDTDQAIRGSREAEARHTQRFVGERAGLAAGGQQPHLAALVVVLAAGVAVGQEAEGPVLPEAGRCVVALAAGELDRLAPIEVHAPQIGDVLGAVFIETGHRDGEPGAVGRQRDALGATEADELVHVERSVGHGGLQGRAA